LVLSPAKNLESQPLLNKKLDILQTPEESQRYHDYKDSLKKKICQLIAVIGGKGGDIAAPIVTSISHLPGMLMAPI